MNISYKRLHGDLCLVREKLVPGGEDQILDKFEKLSDVSFVYHAESGGSLLKHGRTALVEEWVRKYLTHFPNDPLVTVTFEDGTDLERLNHALHTAGYLPRLVEELRKERHAKG